MHVDDYRFKIGGKVYRRVLLRESYRENGKVKKRTIASISHLPETAIEALKVALKEKDNIAVLKALSEGNCENHKSVGAVAALYRVAKDLGITKALGFSESANQALWMTIAHLLGARSRLACVRIANIHATCEVIGLQPFNEDDLYNTLQWVSENQQAIEKRMFREMKKRKVLVKNVYLYDLTSTYVEGTENELAAYGYNRDGKRGKMQINYGLLTDCTGDPISVEAFNGDVKDNTTLKSQLLKLKERFGCERVTIVGDKGMIKSGEIEEVTKAGFNYITSITKSQIEGLINKGIFQLELFDSDIFEVENLEQGVRYIVRRNAWRANEMWNNRMEKIEYMRKNVEKANEYLREHPRGKVKTQLRNLSNMIEKFKMKEYAKVFEQEGKRGINLVIDEKVLKEVSKLDGCYAIKTDLPRGCAEAKEVHDRYKDLALVEWVFREEKSELDVRPVYVRKEERTRGHLFIKMLAYKMERYLREVWANLDVTVEEGIAYLKKLTSIKINIMATPLIRVPAPDIMCKKLLQALNVKLPEVLPYVEWSVDTRKKLVEHRKTRE